MFDLETPTLTPDQLAQPGARRYASADGSNALGPGYRATQDTGRRQPPRQRLRSEDQVLGRLDRKRLQSTTRDLQRNFAIAAWAIRKHLDYVAAHTFQPATGDSGFDRDLSQLIAAFSRKENFDVAGRRRLDKAIRMAEARRTVDGDVALLKLSSGQVQAIEGDRIRTPNAGLPRNFNIEDFTHGVRTDRAGRYRAFIITDRSKRGADFQFRTVMPARQVFLHGFFEGRFDQVRGVSPVASAITNFQDAYENIDYALAKAKVSQLFALAITSRAEEGTGEHTGTGEFENRDPYEVDFGKGPVKLELEPGDDAKFLESNTPTADFQNFMQVVVQIALKSLDIPYSFFDESFTNFFGSRAGLQQYIKSCKQKRADVQELLHDWTEWRLKLAIMDGELDPPSSFSLRRRPWQWIPDGVPWWDPAKEARGHALAVAAGFDTFEHVVRETGGGTGDIYENINRNAEVMRHAEEVGYPLTLPGAKAFNEGSGLRFEDQPDSGEQQQGGNDAD